MMATGKITVEVQYGPGIRAVLDVADCAQQMLDLIPEWNEAERAELEVRLATAKDILENPESEYRSGGAMVDYRNDLESVTGTSGEVPKTTWRDEWRWAAGDVWLMFKSTRPIPLWFFLLYGMILFVLGAAGRFF